MEPQELNMNSSAHLRLHLHIRTIETIRGQRFRVFTHQARWYQNFCLLLKLLGELIKDKQL